MGRQKNITHKKLLKAIEESHGVISVIAKRLKVDWHTANKALKNDPIALEALQDETERIIDVAETVILNALMQEDIRTAQWYLERKGGKRGYNPALELKGNTSEPITLNFIDKEGANFDGADA